jgi:regulatory protein
MKITDIKQQVKRADRYSLYIDGKYLFSLSESELLTLGLRIGLEFDEAELADLQQKAMIDKGYDGALNLIMRRPRSAWELQQYLKRKDYSEEHSEIILNMLSKRGYVDDIDFAKRWVESRRLLKSTSKRRLTQELRQKRVPDDIISQTLAADETDEQAVLRELISKKRTQTRYQDAQKLMQYLMRQGYNYDDIKVVMSED